MSLVVAALAACPNQCSGHGRCGAFDRCTCFHAVGSSHPYRYGYTGADCSQRKCPTGRVYDAISTQQPSLQPVQFVGASAISVPKLRVLFAASARTSTFLSYRRDQTLLVKIMSVSATGTTPFGTFSWKFDEDEYYQPENSIGGAITETTAFALTQTVSGVAVSTGVYIYWDATYGGTTSFGSGQIAAGDIYSFTLTYNDGYTFDVGNGNSAHQEVACSGRGTCDYTVGACSCYSGYTGSSCERTVCPNSCSGHGICQSLTRFVTDASIVGSTNYAAGYDGLQQYGCKCDDGYRGADCSQIECPSTVDPLGGDGGSLGRDCSGRGICDYTTGLCNCFTGYQGESCYVQSNLM